MSNSLEAICQGQNIMTYCYSWHVFLKLHGVTVRSDPAVQEQSFLSGRDQRKRWGDPLTVMGGMWALDEMWTTTQGAHPPTVRQWGGKGSRDP